MDKKGIMSVWVFVFTLISIGVALYLFVGVIGGDEERFIGDGQSRILATYSNAEVDRFNDERRINYAWKDSMLELGSKGGLPNGEAVAGYVYWKKGGKGCFPKLGTLQENLAGVVSSKVNNQGYVFSIDDNLVMLNYSRDYSEKVGAVDFTYTFDPIVKVEFDYGLNEFLNGIELVESIVSSCGDDKTCWDGKSVSYSIDNNNVFKVDVVSGTIKDILGEEEVIIKGAIDFDYNPLQDGEFECLS